MKRSEMVGILKKVLQNGDLATVANRQYASLLDCLINSDVNKIMEEIEKAGMLPPLRLYTYKESFWDRAVCAEMDGDEIKVAMWEEENDKKQ